jgi:eukaryotic-like serine/threonine-protein kinase
VPDALTGRRLGRYHIHQEVGRGGMAQVYRATDTLLQRPVALKVLSPQLSHDPEFARRFEREAVTAANLRHASIITIFDVGESDGLKYIAMEFIAGRSLHAVIAERGQLGLALTIGILAPMAEALQYAHNQRAIHRDIKPHNIMIGTDGRVLLADFGIAIGPQSNGERLTQAGAFLGTPEYLSPEQVQAEPLTGHSDQYALAVVAFECLTGRVPFKGSTPQLLMAHVYTAPPALSTAGQGLPIELDAVLARGLAKDPAARYPDVVAFVEALRGVAAKRGLASVRPGEIAALAVPLGSSAGKETVTLRPSPGSAPSHGPPQASPGGAAPSQAQPSPAPFPIAEVFGAPPPRRAPASGNRSKRGSPRASSHPSEAGANAPRAQTPRQNSTPHPATSRRTAGPARRRRPFHLETSWPTLVFLGLILGAIFFLTQAFRNRIDANNGPNLFVATVAPTIGSDQQPALPAEAAVLPLDQPTPEAEPMAPTEQPESTAIPTQVTLAEDETLAEPTPLPAATPPDGGGATIVYHAAGSLNLTDLQADTTVELLGEVQSIGPAAISPDGTQILFDRVEGESRHLYLFDRVAGETRPLPQGHDAYHPAWAPDGKRIVFASTRDGNPEIYEMDLDSGQVDRWTDDQAIDDYPSFSPDGTMIIWESQRDDGWKIFALDRDGTRRISTSEPGVNDRYPRFAPQGARIVFSSDRGRTDGRFALYIQPLDGGAVGLLLSHDNASASGPQWSPDGQYVVFFSDLGGDDHIYTIDLQDLVARQITNSPGYRWPVWGP